MQLTVYPQGLYSTWPIAGLQWSLTEKNHRRGSCLWQVRGWSGAAQCPPPMLALENGSLQGAHTQGLLAGCGGRYSRDPSVMLISS